VSLGRGWLHSHPQPRRRRPGRLQAPPYPRSRFRCTTKGQPRVPHVRRYEATANRRASLRGIPTKPGYDRDEYPPAMSDEGGKGADVRYVVSADNQSAGSVLFPTATNRGSSSSAGVIADREAPSSYFCDSEDQDFGWTPSSAASGRLATDSQSVQTVCGPRLESVRTRPRHHEDEPFSLLSARST
jgi:hypothetical protein